MIPHEIETKKGWEGTAHKLRLHRLSDPITQSRNLTSWQHRHFANIRLRPFNISDFLTNSDFWTFSDQAKWYRKPVEIQFLTVSSNSHSWLFIMSTWTPNNYNDDGPGNQPDNPFNRTNPLCTDHRLCWSWLCNYRGSPQCMHSF